MHGQTLCHFPPSRRKGGEPTPAFTWQLGSGKTDVEYAPRKVTVPDRVQMVQLCSGMFHGMALCEQGQVYTWGLGMYGQLGHMGTGIDAVPR